MILQALTQALHLLGRGAEAAKFREQVKEALQAGSDVSNAANQLAALLNTITLQGDHQALQDSALHTLQWGSSIWQTPSSPSQGSPIQPVATFLAHLQPETNRLSPLVCEAMDMEEDHRTEQTSRTLEELVAAADGATYVCHRCGGAVSLKRQQVHEHHWCPAIDAG